MGTISVLAGVFTSALTAQTAVFPASTPATKGGWQPFDGSGLPVALTGSVMVLSGSPSGTWSISGGKLVCDATPAADNGVVLRVRDSSNRSCDVTIDATLDGEAVADWDELYAVSGTPSRMSGKTIVMRCTDFTYDGSTNYGRWAPTSTCTIQAERTDGRLPIISNCNIVFSSGGPGNVGDIEWNNIWFYLAQDDTGDRWEWNDPIMGRTIVSTADYCNGLTFNNCRFYSNVNGYGEGYYADEDVKGIKIGSASTDITLSNCEIDHVYYGIDLQAQGTGTIDGCNIHDICADFITVANAANVVITNNQMHTRGGWGGVIHQDVVQFTGNVSGTVSIKGNIFHPGTVGRSKPGVDPGISGVTEAAATTFTVADHANRVITISGTSGTYYLPTAASADGEEFIIRASASGATVAANGAETDADGILPKVMSSGDVIAFRSNGTGWITKEAGTRAATNRRMSGGTLQSYHNKRIGLYDTSGGNVSVTLPASPISGDYYVIDMWADTGNIVTVSPNSGQTFDFGFYGTTPSTVTVANTNQSKKFRWDGSVWQVEETTDGNQGVFSNAFTFSGNMEVAGNIFWVNYVWGITLEGNASNLPPEMFIHHNLVLPSIHSDLNGDGTYGPSDGAVTYGTEGSIRSYGYNTAIADANVCNTLITVNGGGALSHNTQVGYGKADNGVTTKYDAILSGAGDYLPTTKAEAIAAATLISGDYVGAVAYWDFDNGVAKAAPAMTVESNDATISTGVAFTISLSQAIAKSTGNIELYNVTDAVTVETIAASSGSVAVDGCDLNVTFAGSISAGKTYSVRIAADAITSRYSGAWSAVTDNSISATGA